jgi:hypothetical protein
MCEFVYSFIFTPRGVKRGKRVKKAQARNLLLDDLVQKM